MSYQVEHWPDPLTFSNGQPVRSAGEWLGPRRAELRSLFELHMYGEAPAPVPVFREVLSSTPLGSFGQLERWRMTIASPSPVEIELLVALPLSAGPVPAIVALNFHGNHAIYSGPSIPLPRGWVLESQLSEGNRAAERGRGMEAGDWSLEATVEAGFALVTAHYCAIEADQPDAVDGVRAAFGGRATWGAVSAWAWGLSRILDALAQDSRIDSTSVGVTGHSRLGKAALLAAAFDDRFAFAAPVQSGCGGAAPSRGTVGESVGQITSYFPHWFNSRFASYAGREHELPFDQHSLMGMVAPRPLLIANAEDDQWANPSGQVEALEQAGHVYRFMGAFEGTATFIRPGGHSMGLLDWNAVREFARIALL